LDSDAWDAYATILRHREPTGRRKAPPDDKLREAIQKPQPGIGLLVACLLISDSAGCINGEMVVRDGGAYLRSSGAEDLPAWTEALWETQRMARSKDRA